MSRYKKTHTKIIRKGVSIYKTDSSPFWFARIWINAVKKYSVKSTKETSRLDAMEVVEELLEKLNQNTKKNKVKDKDSFDYFSKLLMKQQKSMSGKTRSDRFHLDDEGIILRKDDGINEYFGNRDINDITTYDLRDYLTVLDLSLIHI